MYLRILFLVFFLAILIASAAMALPLADMPERVGGYVYDNGGSPISGATATFTNQ